MTKDTTILEPNRRHEAELENLPLLIPTYDIRTIGAGGGSIARMDAGLLKVGPRSASALPGPMCYGRGGTEPTVTDAALVLGYIDPEQFLDGRMPICADGKVEFIVESTPAGSSLGMLKKCTSTKTAVKVPVTR